MLPLMAACDRQQLDCTSISLADVRRCEETNKGKSAKEILLACLPFSEPLKTNGVWVVGFEKNDFFEGSRTPPPEIIWTETTGANLIADEGVRPPTDRGEYRAVRVEIVGRRALCALGPINPYPIAVEQLKVTEDLGVR